MNSHLRLTGVPCDKVMVFPQGNFSIDAMKVLKSHNFYAAVNTVPHPAEQPVRLTIGELAQPAVLRYGGFPLFLRKPIRQTQNHDIAFNLFFGRPVLIVEHHQIFQHPEAAGRDRRKINRVASGSTVVQPGNRRRQLNSHATGSRRHIMFVLIQVPYKFRTTRVLSGAIPSNGATHALAARLSRCLWTEPSPVTLRKMMPAFGFQWN